MAPEILASKPYRALNADLFALGVILFIMRSVNEPFYLARETDAKYYNFTVHRIDFFWAIHE